MELDKRTIAVTGASGYLASWIVKKLLDHGHTVHGTVRDLTSSNINHLLKFSTSHPGQLHLFEAELLSGDFEAAFSGCDMVVHTASPFYTQGISNAREELLRPALEGTERVLRAVEATESVTHVVLTSSVVAAYNDADEVAKKPNGLIGPDDWNERASLKYSPYNYSKVRAEKRAWEMCENGRGWKLTTILPGFILGPSINRRASGTSLKTVVRLCSGGFKRGVPAFHYGVVDVRDAAEAHVHAIEIDHPQGRYLAVNREMSFLEIADILQKVTENIDYPLPQSEFPSALLYILGPLRGISWKFLRRNNGIPVAFDSRKTIDLLQLRYRKIEDTLRDMVHTMERDNLIDR